MTAAESALSHSMCRDCRFGDRIPDPRGEAEGFFRRRGGPRARWTNMARQILDEPTADVGAAIPHLGVPTLLVAARDDGTSAFAGAEELLQALPERAVGRLHVVGSGGHFGLFDTPLSEEDDGAGGWTTACPEEVRAAAEATARFLQDALRMHSNADSPRDTPASQCDSPNLKQLPTSTNVHEFSGMG